MTRLLTLVVLGIAIVSTLAEATSKRIHVTAQVVQQTFTGDLATPQIGDRLITSVELFDKTDEKVGTGTVVCVQETARLGWSKTGMVWIGEPGEVSVRSPVTLIGEYSLLIDSNNRLYQDL